MGPARYLIFVSLLAPAFSASAQKTLTGYVQAHPIPGPLLVLEPDRARSKAPSSLASFGRKLVTLGALRAVVPTNMIVIDDSLRQDPNLYEGLPAEAKVLYLVRTLDPEQLRKATGDGIGLPDLKGEQRLVLESLLPKPFIWSSYHLEKNNAYGAQGPKGTLSDDDREKVRLKLERAVEFQVFLQNPPDASSSFGTDRYRGKPGTLVYERDRQQEFVGTTAYGLNIRKEVENKLKPSQLDTRPEPFSTMIHVEPETTVGAIIDSIESATSIEIIPDFRIAERKVSFAGGSATARDLIAALAFSVEGTYRKLGNAYVFTSDLEGMGTRKLRLASWEEGLQRDTQHREEQWEHEIGESGKLGQIKYDQEADLAPDDSLNKVIEKDDAEGRTKPIPTSQLTPALRNFLDTWNVEYTQQPIQKDRVGVSSKIIYRYVMPDGTPLRADGELAPTMSFLPLNRPPRLAEAAPAGPLALPQKCGFLLQAKDSATADSAVKLVSNVPGARLWLLTDSAEVLDTAIRSGKSAGVEVGLGICPWRWPSTEADRNIQGQFGQPIFDQEMARLGAQPYSRFDPTGRIARWMPATDAGIPAAWQAFSRLAATPGLVGTMLLETQPFGYEGKHEPWQSILRPVDWAILSHGYTTAQRLAFLRKEGVDPVDIGDRQYWTTPDLRQPYFFDDGLRGMPSIYDGTDDTHPKTRTVGDLWRQWLADANRKAMLALIQSVKPTFVEPRIPNINSAADASAIIYPFNPADPLPTSNARTSRMGDYPGAYVRIPLYQDQALPSASTSVQILTAFASRTAALQSLTPLLDLSALPPSKWETVLRVWLRTR